MSYRFKDGDRVEYNGLKGTVIATYYLSGTDDIEVKWETPGSYISGGKLKRIQPAVSEVVQVGDIVYLKDDTIFLVQKGSIVLNNVLYYASRIEKVVRPTDTEVVWSADDSQAK